MNKYRSAEQRKLIQEEVMDGLDRLQVIDDDKIKPLTTALIQFVQECSGRQFDGQIDMGDYNIVYCLPGRRIIQHFVRTERH